MVGDELRVAVEGFPGRLTRVFTLGPDRTNAGVPRVRQPDSNEIPLSGAEGVWLAEGALSLRRGGVETLIWDDGSVSARAAVDRRLDEVGVRSRELRKVQRRQAKLERLEMVA